MLRPIGHPIADGGAHVVKLLTRCRGIQRSTLILCPVKKGNAHDAAADTRIDHAYLHQFRLERDLGRIGTKKSASVRVVRG